MKFQTETFEEKKARLDRWHDFFAILPREVAPGDNRMLELIERRGEFVKKHPGIHGFWKFRYRAKKDPYQMEPVKMPSPPPPRDGSIRIVVGAPSTL